MTLAVLSGFFDRLSQTSGSTWFLLAILMVALLDSVVPVVPSETMVIIGGVAAGRGDQTLALVVLCAAFGAFSGDNLAYQLGRSADDFLGRTLFRGDKGARRLEWAGRQRAPRGGVLLLTARFIPGGRTAITVSSGLTRQPRRRFALWDLGASSLWALYAALLGYIGGKTFEDNHTLAFVVAFAAAVGVTVVIELVRHVRARRGEAAEAG